MQGFRKIMVIRSLFIRVQMSHNIGAWPQGPGRAHRRRSLLGDACSHDGDVSEPHWCSGSKRSLSSFYVAGAARGDMAMDKTKAVDLMLCPGLVTMSAVFSSQKKVLYDPILYLRLLLLLLSHFSRVRLCAAP